MGELPQQNPPPRITPPAPGHPKTVAVNKEAFALARLQNDVEDMANNLMLPQQLRSILLNSLTVMEAQQARLATLEKRLAALEGKTHG